MIEILKRTVSVGIEIALRKKSEIEELLKELVDKGKVSEKDGRKIIEDFLSKSGINKEKIEEICGKGVNELLKALNIATKDEVNDLEKKINALKKKIIIKKKTKK